MKIAISGFGRIGRLALRVIAEKKLLGKKLDVVAINDTHDPKAVAHLFKYDSTHGRFGGQVGLTLGSTPPSASPDSGNSLLVDGLTIPIISSRDPLALPWKSLGVEVVLEATGAFTDRDGATKHLTAGAKKVLISAPAKNPDVTIVPGVNDKMYKKSEHKIISLASCTTNCLAPVAKVLHDNLEIKSGFMTTCHAYTNDQKVLDDFHKDLRRTRASAANIIPTSTGAAKAIGEVIPDLKGKLDGLSLRVPVITGSINDLTVIVGKQTTKDEVNSLLKEASEKPPLKGILGYTQDPIVSSDVIGDPHSGIVDAGCTYVIGNSVKVLTWYDNEWGYTNRLVDALEKIL